MADAINSRSGASFLPSPHPANVYYEFGARVRFDDVRSSRDEGGKRRRRKRSASSADSSTRARMHRRRAGEKFKGVSLLVGNHQSVSITEPCWPSSPIFQVCSVTGCYERLIHTKRANYQTAQLEQLSRDQESS